MRVAALVLVTCWCVSTPSSAQEEVDAGAETETGTEADSGTETETETDSGTETETETEADSGTGMDDLLPEELRPTLSVAIEPDGGIMTGDLVTLVITAEARSADDDVAVPRQDLAPFEVLDSSAEQNGRRFVFRIELLALEPGEHEVGPVRLRVVTADTLGAVETDPIAITVGSVLGNEPDAEPKPPTDPVDVVEEDYTLAWIGGGLLGMLLLALAMFFLARWWLKRDKPEPPPPPPRPPWEVAMEELAALRASLDEDTEANRLTRWVDALSDTLRVYLGDRYGFEGIESTTDEAVAFIRKKNPKGITAEQVAGILSDCDLVKFAKATPERERCLALLDAATGIVKATTARLGGEVVTEVPGEKPKEAEADQ